MDWEEKNRFLAEIDKTENLSILFVFVCELESNCHLSADVCGDSAYKSCIL